MNDEPKALHGPWTWNESREARLVEGPWLQIRYPHGPWVDADDRDGTLAAIVELARLAAENAELKAKCADLKSMYDNHREGLEAELKEAEVERDRLTAENAQQKKVIDAYEATIGDSAGWLAERDRLRALVARMRLYVTEMIQPRSRQRMSAGEVRRGWDALLADREGKARAAGRRQGLAEAAEYCQREAESLYWTVAGSVLAAVAKEIQALAEEGDK